jgi:hypothetical protein
MQIPPKRWWKRLPVRLSVRTLIVVVFVIAGALGWLTHRARLQRQAIAAVLKAGGNIEYGDERHAGVSLSPGFFSWISARLRNWLIKNLGEEYGLTVVWVNLRDTDFNDADLARLAALDRIEYLDLGGTKVSDAWMASLERLTRLRGLDIRGTAVGDPGLAHLKGLVKLENLIVGTGVTDAGLAHLKGLGQLEFLNLRETKVSDSGLVNLEGLDQLAILNFGNTGVGDAGLAHLAGLTRLYTLDLIGTKVTDAGLSHLRNLARLGNHEGSISSPSRKGRPYPGRR